MMLLRKLSIRVRGLSLRVKLILLFALLLLGIAAFMLTFFPARMESQSRHAALNRATAIASVLAAAAGPALEFDDPVNASQLLSWLGSTPEATWASLDRPDGSRVAAWHPEAIPARRPHARMIAEMDEQRLIVVTPVRGLAGETGSLSVGFSLADLQVEKKQARATVAGATAGMFLLGLLLCALLGTMLVAPIRRVTSAALAIARGHLHEAGALTVSGHGEVGVMSRALDFMLRCLLEQQTILTSQSEASVEGILIASTSGRVFSFNQRFRQLWGIDGIELPDVNAVAEALAARASDPEQASGLFREDGLAPGQENPGRSGELVLQDGKTLAFYLAPVVSPTGKQFGRGYYFRDVTPEKRAATELRELNGRLLDASRQAGMAEVATGVLHNVGNVLNSINVSATLAKEYLGMSRAPALRKAGELIAELSLDPTLWLAGHAKAKQLAPFLVELSQVLAAEHANIGREIDLVVKNVEHVKHIVKMQNTHAKGGGVLENVPLQEVVEEGVRMYAQSFARHDIQVERAYQELPPGRIDRHRILQILLNLLANAKHAVDGNAGKKWVRIAVEPSELPGARVVVTDNGVGIPTQSLERIFAAGYSTRKNGHGFGLHNSALTAREMGGALVCHSDGPGTGAQFTLEIPFPPSKESSAS